MRRALPLCLVLAACSQDPVRYIPEAERTAAAAEVARPISVDEMLARTRNSNAAPASSISTVPGRLLIRFDGAAITPDAGQKASLREFAASTGGRSLMVASRPGSFDDPGTPVLGQRRAVAVARELSSVAQDVEMRFDPALPPGVVVVTQEARP